MTADLFSPEFITHNAATQMRDNALASVGSHNEPWTSRAASAALYLAASDGEVNSDSLDKYFPRPDYINANSVGAVFSRLIKQNKLKIVGYTQSLRKSAHARRIAIYALVC